MVGDGNYKDLIGEFPHDNVIREPLEHEPLRSSRACLAWHVCEGDDCLFKKRERSIDRVGEFNA